MADIFISYAREDKSFVRRLHEALAARKLEAWVDWTGIPPTADFMREIHAAIEAADTVVLILSPDWSVSKVCALEAAHALGHRKRLMPLVCRDVEPDKLPTSVATINWIFFRESDDFDAALETLLEALKTDLERTRALTRLLVRAIEWDAKGRETSFLLRGVDLASAESAFIAGAEGEQPQLTPLQREFVLASRADSVKRQRRLVISLTTGLIIALGLAALAFWQYRLAEQRRTTEEIARHEAERKTRIATSQRLGALADGALERYPQRSILLAVEAAQIVLREKEPVPVAAEQSLRKALWTVGGRAFGGAGLPINEVALSANSRWLAMAGRDAAYVWELGGNDPPLVLSEPGREVVNVAIGPDARWLLSLTVSGGVWVWDLTGKTPISRPLSLVGHTDGRYAGRLTADRRLLLTITLDGTLACWNLSTADPPATAVIFKPRTPIDPHQLLDGGKFSTSTDGRVARDESDLATSGRVGSARR
jgi:hypothetical protein